MKKVFTDCKGRPRRFFSPKAIAESLGLHPRTILRRVKEKTLEAYEPTPGCIRIPEEEIERLLRERSIGRAA